MLRGYAKKGGDQPFPVDFDVQQIIETADRAASRTTKRQWIKEGYSHQLSLYGVNSNRETGESNYKRIEILSNVPWTESIVSRLYTWFSYMVPGAAYTIWIYDGGRDSFKIVGEFN